MRRIRLLSKNLFEQFKTVKFDNFTVFSYY